MPENAPTVPDYLNRCTSNIVPELLNRGADTPWAEWVPNPLRNASQVVLLVVDGMGWNQIRARQGLTPALNTFDGQAITTSVPTTTPSCLTTIVTGTAPAQHGLIGYRMRLNDGRVLDSQKWHVDGLDASAAVDPYQFQQSPPFRGRKVPAIIRQTFIGSGLTNAQFWKGPTIGYQFTSSLPLRINELLKQDEPLIYVYYDGLDITAHNEGLGELYDAELAHVDQIIEGILNSLPSDVALVVTADHGHVQLDDGYVDIDSRIVSACELLTGEPRFRWLHLGAGRQAEILELCHELYDDVAWVRTVDQAINEGWFGSNISPEVRGRLGDIAIAAASPLAFMEPTSHAATLASRHGSLTNDEVMVPFLARLV